MSLAQPTPTPRPSRARTLSRQGIVDRALQIGDAEGLEAVSLRRLASELGVTPMALYRHVKDKQDLINAMYETIVDGADLKAGITPSMPWADQLRRSIMNGAAIHQRPVALPLAIAYSGAGSPSIWRMFEDQLDILLRAGFARREALLLNRMLTNVLGGYMMMVRQTPPIDPHELLLARKQFELVLLGLPPAEYPNVVDSARDLVDMQFREPRRMWEDTVDLLVAGVEAMLERTQARRRETQDPAR